MVEALEALNRLSGETMTLFVVDSEGRLLGSLTDGDIRRALLAGHSLGDTAASVCHRECVTDITTARARGIALLPVLEEGRITDLIDLRKRRGYVPAEALLMAGGTGERLRPLTERVPKPMLPVGGKPIIDRNIDLLRSFGIRKIHVAVNYLKQQIIEHLGPEIDIIEEPFKLGTAGALSLMGEPETPHILMMNADLLTDIDLEAMYAKHTGTEAWLTMAVVPYNVSVPFAIVEHTGDRATGLTEKPTFNYYANAGIYLMRREAAKAIQPGRPTDATELVEHLIREGHRVTLFPAEGRWLDIGSPDDYRHACELTAREGEAKTSGVSGLL